MNENAYWSLLSALVIAGLLWLLILVHGRSPFSVFDRIIIILSVFFVVVGLVFAAVALHVSVRNYEHMQAKLKLYGPSAISELDSVGHCAQVGMKMAQRDLEREG